MVCCSKVHGGGRKECEVERFIPCAVWYGVWGFYDISERRQSFSVDFRDKVASYRMYSRKYHEFGLQYRISE